MDRDYFQDALQTFNGGDWYGWKKIGQALTECLMKIL